MNFNEILPEVSTFFPEKKLSTNLPWQPAKINCASRDLNDSEVFRSSPHKWFNTMLRLSDVCDIEQVEVPGAIIMLPWGVKIAERFLQLIRNEAENNCYDEYSYPCLIPKSYFNPLQDLIDFKQSVLNVSANSENLDLALTPTGEYPIYHHWSSVIKSNQDLPKRVFQRAKYFRPITSAKRSGGSVFLSMEASDVYEFHSAFGNDNAASFEASQLMLIFKKIIDSIGTIVLWTLRPSWTNRGYLYKWCYGGDAILPSRNSVQVASTYYQGDVFSRRFNIAVSKDKEKCFTYQATGAITRRLLFANIFQTIRSDGSLCLHPHIAPIQVTLLTTSCHSADDAIITEMIEALQKSNFRIKVIKTDNKKQLRKEEKNWYRLGIPLKIIYFGRQDFDKIKLIMIRNDTGEEYPVVYQEISTAVSLALEDIINYQHYQVAKENVIDCLSIEDMEDVLQKNKIASMALNIDPQCVQNIEQLKKGEVLGYYSNNIAAQCVITGNKTISRALVSRRI